LKTIINGTKFAETYRDFSPILSLEIKEKSIITTIYGYLIINKIIDWMDKQFSLTKIFIQPF